MTCHVLRAGGGYTYLTRQVASGDVQRSAYDPLVAYYQVEGNPPGQWVGSGLADLGVSGVVSEEQMLALFGEGLHPNANALIAMDILVSCLQAQLAARSTAPVRTASTAPA